jgi:hypothetical protein
MMPPAAPIKVRRVLFYLGAPRVADVAECPLVDGTKMRIPKRIRIMTAKMIATIFTNLFIFVFS